MLALGEYRESVDIDFLCADRAGYRDLRTLLANKPNLNAISRAGEGQIVLRDIRADQYGLRTIIECEASKIKFEIIREARVDLAGSIDPRFGIPVLDRDLMYAEKLLANSDRLHAPETQSRDIIDLSVMISRWGAVPSNAWAIAKDAYGEKVERDFYAAIEKIRDPAWLEKCCKGMAIAPETRKEIVDLHGGPFPRQSGPFD